MTRPVILVDVDGVLANFIEANLRTLRTLGVHREHDDVTTWDMGTSLRLDDTARAMMEFRWSLPGFCASLPVYPDAVAGIDMLRSCADVHPVTAPMFTPHWQYERQEWLVEYFGFGRKQIVQTHAKHLVAGDVLIDDKPEHVIAWQGAHPDGVGILWARPYNAGAPCRVRTASWSEVIDLAAKRGSR